MPTYPCDAKCNRYFVSVRALNSHLSLARSCIWYKKGKLRDLGADGEEEEELLQNHLDNPDELEEDVEDYDPELCEPGIGDIDLRPYGEEGYLIPDIEEGHAGPGPHTAENRIRQAVNHRQRVLDDDTDDRIIITDPKGGRIMRHLPTDPRLATFQTDKNGDAPSNQADTPDKYAPFTSQMDWRVAEWVVAEAHGPYRAFLNKFLEIPEVR